MNAAEAQIEAAHQAAWDLYDGGDKQRLSANAARAIADAVVAAGPDPAKVAAEALREAAVDADKSVVTGLEQTRPDLVAIWLRRRADRLEAPDA